MQTKVRAKPEITVQSDFGRGSQRYLLTWDGYNREVFDLLKASGAKYDKSPGTPKGYTWCTPADLRECLENLQANEYVVHSPVDLTALPVKEKAVEQVTDVFDIISVTGYSVIVNFNYGPKFNQMVAAIKRIHLDDREYDPIVKDWKIRHKALPTLIWGWKQLGIDVERLEAIQKLVCN